MTKDPTVYVQSREELAAVFGVDRRTVARWLEAGGPAKTPKGYDVSAWVRWRQKHAPERTASDGPPMTLAEAKLRHVTAQGERAELFLAKARGEVMRKEEHEAELLAHHRAFEGYLARILIELPKILKGTHQGDWDGVVDEYIGKIRDELAECNKVLVKLGTKGAIWAEGVREAASEARGEKDRQPDRSGFGEGDTIRSKARKRNEQTRKARKHERSGTAVGGADHKR